MKEELYLQGGRNGNKGNNLKVSIDTRLKGKLKITVVDFLLRF